MRQFLTAIFSPFLHVMILEILRRTNRILRQIAMPEKENTRDGSWRDTNDVAILFMKETLCDPNPWPETDLAGDPCFGVRVQSSFE